MPPPTLNSEEPVIVMYQVAQFGCPARAGRDVMQHETHDEERSEDFVALAFRKKT